MRRVIAAFSLCGALYFPARAEDDIDLARALLKQDEAPGPELVERLAKRVEISRKNDAAYIRSCLQRYQARHASPEKQVELLKQALENLKLAQGPNAPRGVDLEAELGAVAREWRKATGVLPGVSGPQRVALGKEAAATLDAKVEKSRTAADAAQKKVDPLIAEVERFYEKPENEGKPLPRHILEPLTKHFDEWMKAEQEWVLARLEQIDCLDESDENKKKLASTVAERCEAVADHSALNNWAGLRMFFTFTQGRAYALVLDYEKATEVWNTLLAMEGATDDQALNIRKSIVADLSRLLTKSKRDEKFIEVIDGVLRDITLKRMFDQEQYRWIIPEYARAQARMKTPNAEGVEKGLSLLQAAAIELEKSSPGWANDYRVAIGDVIEAALVKKLEIKITPQQWLSAASGTAVEAARLNRRVLELKSEGPEKAEEAKALWQKTLATLESATKYYRRAIKETRAMKDVIARLKLEPQAWLELGNCLMAAGDLHEAIITYMALRDTFQPSARAKWIPEYKDAALAKRLKQALADVDATVAKGVEKMELALARNEKIHNHPQDLVNADLRNRYNIYGEQQTDNTYETALNEAKTAEKLAAAIDTDRQNAAKNGEEAIAKFLSAAEKFQKLTASNRKYESALFLTAQSYQLASSVAARIAPAATVVAAPDRVQVFASKALEAFAKIADHASKNQPDDDEAVRLRPEREGAMLLARSSLHCITQEWEKAAAAANEYLLWQQRTQAKDQRSLALLNKFRALIGASAARVAPAADGYLNDACETLQRYRELKPEEHTLYLALLTPLQRRYALASAQAEGAKLGDEANAHYAARQCQLQQQRVTVLEALSAESVPLDEYTSLLMHLDRCGRTRDAAERALAILKKFDPQNKQMRIADDEKVWQAMLAKMSGDVRTATKGIIFYRDPQKQERCRQEHRILLDYMYDTIPGRQFNPGDNRRPEFDRYNQDLSRAQSQLERIKREFPDSQTLEAKFGDGKRSPLGEIEEEIDYRRRIEATRSKLVELAPKVAAQLDQGNMPADAARWRDVAREHLTLLVELWGETPELLMKRAELEIATGKLKEAEDTLFQVKTTVDNQSRQYFDASRRLSELYAQQKRWTEALEYPEFLKVTNSPMMKHWPEIDAFMQKCEEKR